MENILDRQTDRPFHIRFQEHFHEYKHGNGKSKFEMENKNLCNTF